MWIDCSPEALDRYRQLLGELEAKLYSANSSVSDRSRSVSMINPDAIQKLIDRLEGKIEFCILGPRLHRRLAYKPLFKAL